MVVLAACGGGNKASSGSTSVQDSASMTDTTSGADPVQQDALVEAALRGFVTEVETCFVDQMDYSKCKRPPATKADIGSGSGQVELTAATATTYTAVGHSGSGNTFKVEKQSSGAAKRTCDQADTGGCKQGGTW